MKKADIVKLIKERTEFEKEDVELFVEHFLDVVMASMKNGDNIYMRGFGTFYNKKKARKIGRNITKGTTIVIKEHFAPAFKPSKFFINKIKSSEKVKLANK